MILADTISSQFNATTISIMAAAVVFILKAVFDFIDRQKMRNGDGSPITFKDCAAIFKLLTRIEGKVSENHDWHKPNQNGVQEWKNPTLANAVEKLVEVTEENTRLIRELRQDMREQRERDKRWDEQDRDRRKVES